MACETNTWLVVFFLFLAANCMQHCALGVSQVPCLFIFGDSMSDSGNNNQLPTTTKSNYKPYGVDFPLGPTGRFTNGRTEIDIISQFLEFENFIPPFANTSGSDILKGVNYASGGAGIRSETGSHTGGSISLRSQLANHSVIVSEIATRLGSPDLAQEYLEKCLYYVNIGSNDYMANYFLPQFYPTSSMYTVEQYTEVLIEELSQHFQALHELGARKYASAGLGLIGCTLGIVASYGTNESCVEEQNTAAYQFNNKLKALVDKFNYGFSADSKFIFLDTQALAIYLRDKNGFEFPESPCCEPGLTGECIPDGKPCYNRNDYVFWDAFHTTEKWNLLNALTNYNSTSTSDFTYPMDIKHLVHYEIKMELDLTDDSTSQLSATE
ncbi:GDSL esterase/lipase At1g29670-like [Vigna umbellata]|nr:GDSL esterase/lipase At1g29670-like [Vigna umbellata]